MEMVREFDERVELFGYKLVVKDVVKFVVELGVDFYFKYLDFVCVMSSGEVILLYCVKGVLKECVEEKYERDVCGLEW